MTKLRSTIILICAVIAFSFCTSGCYTSNMLDLYGTYTLVGIYSNINNDADISDLFESASVAISGTTISLNFDVADDAHVMHEEKINGITVLRPFYLDSWSPITGDRRIHDLDLYKDGASFSLDQDENSPYRNTYVQNSNDKLDMRNITYTYISLNGNKIDVDYNLFFKRTNSNDNKPPEASSNFDAIKKAYTDSGYQTNLEDTGDEATKEQVKQLLNLYSMYGYKMAFIGKNLNTLNAEFYMLFGCKTDEEAVELEKMLSDFKLKRDGKDVIVSIFTLGGEPNFQPFITKKGDGSTAPGTSSANFEKIKKAYTDEGYTLDVETGIIPSLAMKISNIKSTYSGLGMDFMFIGKNTNNLQNCELYVVFETYLDVQVSELITEINEKYRRMGDYIIFSFNYELVPNFAPFYGVSLS